MSVNRYVASGNLTRDPEEGATKSGVFVLELGIAVNERRKNARGEWEDQANFLDCVMYGSRAEAVSRYLHKGDKVTVDGKLRQERWEKDGQKRSKIRVVIDDIDFSGNKRQEAEPEREPLQDGVYDEDILF